LERLFLDLLRAADPPTPQVNTLVEGFVVAAYWPAARLVVELQGYAYHSDRAAFERDHGRLARLKLAGCEVLALTWRQVTEEPAWVAGAIRSLLGHQAATSDSRGRPFLGGAAASGHARPRPRARSADR
jgi:Protein of unknown function (DUF559)